MIKILYKQKSFFQLIIIIILFLSSYYRELWFRSINAILAGEEYFYAKTTALPFLMDWSQAALLKLKYGLTVGFSLLFMGLSLWGIRKGFEAKLPYYLLLTYYGLIVLLAGIALLLGLSWWSFQEVYPFLRKLIGFVHSPLPYLMLSAASYAWMKLETKG
jgi:hypothetical protein